MVTFYTYLFLKCMLREQFELSEILHSNLKVFKIPFYFEMMIWLVPLSLPSFCPHQTLTDAHSLLYSKHGLFL